MPSDSLQDIRARIDRIDQELHRLMVERTELAGEVWKAKDRSASGLAAVHPAREAQMLRAFAHRHRSEMPLPVLWRIWRELIIANIRAQSPIAVHVACDADETANTADGRKTLWDLARAHYGFETIMTRHDTAVETAQAASRDNAVAVLPADGIGDWAGRITTESNFRVFGILPQIEQPTKGNAKPHPPQAYLAGDVVLQPSGEDTTLLRVPGHENAAITAAQLEGHTVLYTRPAGSWTLLGIAGMDLFQDTDLALPADQKWAEMDVTCLGAHANALTWK